MTVIFFLLPLSIAVFVLLVGAVVAYEMLFGEVPSQNRGEDGPALTNAAQRRSPANASRDRAQDSSTAA